MKCNHTIETITIGNNIGIICKKFRFNYLITELNLLKQNKKCNNIYFYENILGKKFDTILIDKSGLKLSDFNKVIETLQSVNKINKSNFYYIDDINNIVNFFE